MQRHRRVSELLAASIDDDVRVFGETLHMLQRIPKEADYEMDCPHVPTNRGTRPDRSRNRSVNCFKHPYQAHRAAEAAQRLIDLLRAVDENPDRCDAAIKSIQSRVWLG